MIRLTRSATQIPSKEFANLFEEVCGANLIGGAPC